MWRFAVALAVVPILVACSGAGDDSADDAAEVDPCVLNAPTPSQTSIAAPVPVTTLDDAQRRTGYDLKVPSAMPDAVELRSVAIEEVQACPGGSPVWLAYEGAGYSITLRQTPYEQTIRTTDTTPVMISGVDGVAVSSGSSMHVMWQHDGTWIAATGLMNDTLNEDRFLEILESIE